ncbi:MAG TPA: hypothetical protein VFQ67_05805 [Allosphingosinicella sp.]|nr:hypothetical protein [Allosphingosinicella sp.]
MPRAAQSLRSSRRRAILLLGAATLAFAAAGRASAQAFQGNPSFAAGFGTRVTAPGTETITIDSPTAIINWDPTDMAGLGTIDFLPAGNTATFQNGVNNPNFVVLNRIIPLDPTRAVALNGNVISQLQTSGGVVRGGTVAFFSPGGLLIGSKAVFDVGSLLLTTIDPEIVGSGEFFVGNRFNLVKTDPKSFITIDQGASIKALQEGSYVALASPRILQQGNVQVNGAAAYVAAESVALTIDNGLFDIEVAIGSSSTLNTLVHEGTTGGPAPGAADDNHRIYMVAVPKNSAITALLSGSAGFDAAADATIVNGEIVLSAGRNIVAGDFVDVAKVPPSSFDILGGTYSSDIRGTATADFVAGSSAADLKVDGDVRLQGDAHAFLVADNRTVRIDGDLELRSDRIVGETPAGDPVDAAAGEAAIMATGTGQVQVTGASLVSASASGGFDVVGNVAGSATGGIARVSADKGSVSLLGKLTLAADGTAGTGPSAPAAGASGVGGSAALTALNGGAIAVSGGTAASASGFSSRSDSAGSGGTGAGGQVLLFAESGGAISTTLAGVAQGVGGDNENPAGSGGAGFGGDVKVAAEGGSISLPGGFLRSLGTGGRGFTGGTGTGGDASVGAAGGTISLGIFELTATGLGGDAEFLDGGRGGDGIGGTAIVLAQSGAAPSSISGGNLFVFAQGRGGAGGIGSGAVAAGGRGGDGTGGTAIAVAEAANGTLLFAGADLRATGVGGAGGQGGDNRNGGPGGDGRGGSAMASTVAGAAGPSISGSASFARLQVEAEGVGGAGGAGGDGLPTAGGNGGRGVGGVAEWSSTGAPATAPLGAGLDADGRGGAGGASDTPGAQGQADGGRLVLGATRADFAATPGLLGGDSISGTANAVGDGSSANTPGRFDVTADNGDIVLAGGFLKLQASATGAPAAHPPSSVTATNGSVGVDPNRALILISGGDLTLAATGTGRVSGGAVQLAAPNGEISISHSGRDPAASTIQASSLAASSLGRFVQNPGSRMTVAAGAGITAGGDVLLADAAAGLAFDVASGGIIVIDGPVAGQTLSLTSKDIGIGAAGTLGNAATLATTFNIVPTGVAAVIGGSGPGPGYTLDSAELGRIASQRMIIEAPVTGANPDRLADVFLRAMNLSGTQSGAGLAEFRIDTPGRVRVDGAVAYGNASSTDAFLITAGERVQVLTPSGSILVSDSLGAPAGRLAIAAPEITVTDPVLAAQLAADPNFPGRSVALLNGGGIANPVGYLMAGGIDFTVGSHLFVQNSGGASGLAGLTVGSGGLSIRGGAAPITVVGFGRKRNPDGTFVTGNAFFALADFGKAAGTTYSADSELNLCNINTGACPAPPPLPPDPPPPDPPPPDPPPPGPPPPDPPPPDPPPEPQPPGRTGRPTSAAAVLGPLVPAEVRRAGDVVDVSLGQVPLIDEPVTSGGDSGLWTGDDDEDEEEEEEGGRPR